VKLAFNLFDVLLLATLVLGLAQGRKRGMSGEWTGLLKWLVVLFGCAAIYWPLGRIIAEPGVFSFVSSCLIAYLGATLLIILAFSWAERRLRGKLVGSDFFGQAEYYLGAASGAVRMGCLALIALALLNARSFSPAEVRAMEAYQSSVYGSHVFPSLPAVQAEVFDQSLTGPWIKQNLGFLLINSEEPKVDRTH
jgi:Colicin V production protein